MLRLSLAVVLCFAFALPALAQQTASTTGAIATVPPTLDIGRLPVNIGRIGRQLGQAKVREERDGLKIRYTIDVFGQAPKIQLITPLDNLFTGDVPRSAPTHGDMIRMMTPQEFSAPVINILTVPRRK